MSTMVSAHGAGGVAIAAGFGWPSAAWVGSGLTAAGVLVFAIWSHCEPNRDARSSVTAPRRAHDLHRRRPRTGLHRADIHHHRTVRASASAQIRTRQTNPHIT